LQATPATWTILLASGWNGKKDLKALTGGEALQPGLARDLLGKVNSLWNLYGPTETTIYSSCELISDYDHILIGRPVDNTQFHILYNNQEQPVGAIGELCIGGMGVSKGYHNREELNTEKFIKWNDQIMYRTGDLARFLDNGKIELLGRTDNQIKLHGFRIEPGEIEFQLSQIEGVKEAVVKLEKNGESNDWLIGYLNVTDSFKLNREQIVKSIEKLLPGYMIPSSFMIMKEFPRTLNGKIDRKALTFNINNIPDEEKEEITEFSEFEKSLVKIWQEILKVKNIKRNESFFDIGGNSLLAIQILTRIKEELNLNISFKTFLQNPTIDKLSSQLQETGQISGETIELIHLTERRNLPLTLNQKRLWLISTLQPDVPSYIIQYTCYLEGSLDRGIFQKSLEILFQRHHIVFSVIQEDNGEPYCDIIPKEVNISFMDYSELPENEKEIKVYDIINADSRKVFDLKNGPLYRLYLIMTKANQYYFHLSIHHIIFDGWSWTVLVNDLKEIYNSLLNKREVSLERIEFQQYDYAHLENNSANTNKRNDLIEFWKNNLNGASQILNFPYDFPRPEQPSGKGRYEPIRIPEELSEKLRSISRKEDSSLFTTMLSVFGIQMHKYSGQDDINIGLPVAYRPYSKLENIFGMFVNTVVIRLKLDKNLTFKNIIHQTNETTLNAIAHQELPFKTIVDLVNPERVSNVNPLFQVGFVWQNNLNMPLELDGIRSKRITGMERTTPFDIVMYLWEDGTTIQGEIEYSADLLKHETILRLKNHFLTLINKLLENSDTPLNSLSIISDDEKKLIENINNTITPYPKNKTIVQLFEDQVALYPQKIAVAFNKDVLTYKQLNEKANQLARTLRKSGIGSDTPVGILADKSLDLIVGILGILKAGGGYVPIEPEYPVQRINFILEDSGCKVLLTQDKYINLPVEGVRKLNLNSKYSFHWDKSDVKRINDSFSLAYIMYTSGTTGQPKGSMIQQYSVNRLIRNTNYIELTPDDRILLTGSIGFDATTFEIWGALLNGGALYLAEKETILNPGTLGEELSKNDITVLWLTSPLFTMIAESQTDIFSGLKYLLSGGDVLSASHINKVRKDNPQLKIINAYGPTENTTFSTTYLIERDFDRNIPIGKPISNSTAYIFDSNMNYLPVGVIGELYVGGDGLSKGYLNHEDLNRKSFIDHPFIKGEKIYRTGDYARLLMDGNIEFHGRIDNQLKVRGFRVELGEIESVISGMDGIIDVVIKPIKIKEGDTRLAAFLNVSDAFSMDTKELKNRIKEKLPPQMVPSMFKLMHGFPKTVNGKIDKDALKVDISVIDQPEENGELTPTEKKIYDIWSKALLTKDILKTDNFFDVGGSSLLAASVLSKLESQFKINIRLKTIFDNPRLKDLADFIDGSLPVLSKK
jgi:tyrocidine synthetase-3